jgi:hypothetical protein
MTTSRNDDIPAIDSPVTPQEISTMVRGMLRYPPLFLDAVRAGFTPAVFTGTHEIVYFCLTNAAAELYQKHDAITPEMLTTAIKSTLGQLNPNSGLPVVLTPEEEHALFGDGVAIGFIEEAMRTEDLSQAQEMEYRKFCEEILRRFMTTRIVKNKLQSLLNRVHETDSAPLNMHSILDEWQQRAQRIVSIGSVVANTATMPEFGAHIHLPPPPVPTTLPWIDNFIRGFRNGDIIGVLGPFGGGKTTMLVCATTRLAEQFYLRGENKLAVYVGFEDGNEKMNYLFWSAAARIDRNLFLTLSKADDLWSSFSTSSSLKPYDKMLPENKNGKIMLGEKERWDMAKGWLNNHMYYLDFSHSQLDRARGKGGVPEIVAALDRIVEETGKEIGFIAIDYAGLLVERMMIAAGDRYRFQEKIDRPIKQLPDELRRLVGAKHSCAIMLAHQLAPGEVAKISVTKYISYTESQGGKSFAENLHSCVCINKRDPETGVSTINWAKIRAFKPETPYGLIRIDDPFVGIHLANDYVICPAARKILSKKDVRPVSREEAARSASHFDKHGADDFSQNFFN